MLVHEKKNPPVKIFHSTNSIYGIIVWFSVFAVIIPYLLVLKFGPSAMIRYLPVIDLFANVLTNAGDDKFHNFYNDVYDVDMKDYIDYFTMNLINVLALSGVALTILYESVILKKDVRRSMMIAVVMFIMTYILPTRLVGMVGQGARRWLAKLRGTDVKGRYGWFGLLVSFTFVLILVLIELTIVLKLI